MFELIKEALIDSLKLVPFLLVIYIVIAWLEYRFGKTIQTDIRKAGRMGPLLGALFGCLPQCGFSVVGSALYTRGLVTTGTLLAVFLSTSDEAVPIIMADPGRIGLVLPLLITKVALALIAGFAVDGFSRRKLPAALEAEHDHPHEEPDEEAPIEVDACCGHHLPDVDVKRTLIWHPLLHTAQVFAVLFVISIGINWLVGEEGANLGQLLGLGSLWQPIVAALVGLIPNCGASVALTDVYLNGGLSFGAVIAGLSTSGGLGLLVLLKENRDHKDTLRVLGLLVAISIAAGILIQVAEGYFVR